MISNQQDSAKCIMLMPQVVRHDNTCTTSILKPTVVSSTMFQRQVVAGKNESLNDSQLT